ncbi:uncharacterized protein KIAA1143 homolog [Zootermopsis nevadensis]|uniref:uncharacterized protein KIAA1143 homolog n=1 Tax=Zootermopsis nevadensis TaxID=136037 RepID=UPI000B8EA297|nr:uncharacterized protein KIAA1143 homolog [Zootermopsis nevadensis]
MSKRSITYIKPQEPSFLTRLKAEAGYKEPDTVETKREILPCDADELKDKEDDQPVVVVLKPGDLTAEEAAKIEKEEEQAPANLEDRIVFRAPTKSSGSSGSKRSRSEEDRPAKRNKVTGVKNTKLLSFDQEDEDDV